LAKEGDGLIVLILAVVFIILTVLILIKFFGHIFKAFFLIGAMLAVLMIILGVFVVLDVLDLKNNIGSQPSKIVYIVDNKVLLALEIDPVKVQQSSNDSENLLPEGITVLDPTLIQNWLPQKGYEHMKKSDYKLLLVDDAYLESLNTRNVFMNGLTVSGDKLKAILKSTNQSVRKEDKAFAFLLLLQQSFTKDNLPLLFKGVRDGTLIIYPETPIVDVLKFTPQSMVNIALSTVKTDLQQTEQVTAGKTIFKKTTTN
jgi:hypothetical protein